MAIKSGKEVFVKLLSDLRHREERAANIMQEISDAASDKDVKEALESRVFLKNQILSTFDRCFALIGEKPMQSDDRLRDVFIEDFRKELAAIESPLARDLFVLAKAKHLIHFHIGELAAVTRMADLSGHYGVGVLLEACLAENMALVDRARRLIRRMVESEVGVRLAA